LEIHPNGQNNNGEDRILTFAAQLNKPPRRSWLQVAYAVPQKI